MVVFPPIDGATEDLKRTEDSSAFMTGLDAHTSSPVYRVEMADISDTSKLPDSIPLDKVMTNIKNNLNFHFHFTSNATKALKRNRNAWFKDFQAPHLRRLLVLHLQVLQKGTTRRCGARVV